MNIAAFLIVFSGESTDLRKVIMTDYKEKFERWQKKATEKFEEIDAQLGLKEKIEERRPRRLSRPQKKVPGILKTEAEKTEVGKQAVKVAEDVHTLPRTKLQKPRGMRANRSAMLRPMPGTKAGDVVVDIAGKAGEIIDDAADIVGTNAKRVSQVVGFGSSLSTTIDAGIRSAKKAVDWARKTRCVPQRPEFRWLSERDSAWCLPELARTGFSIPLFRMVGQKAG